MELKSLRYFLEVARLKNFTAAARSLNLTQPALSKQIQELENEFGAALLIRGKRETRLTEAGKYLFKTASEIVELAERTKDNIIRARSNVGGDVYIAGGETRTMKLIARAIKMTQAKHPEIKFHMFSGNGEAVAERLERGLADFGAFVLPAPVEKFDYINLPMNDRWGLLLKKDDALAACDKIRPPDLTGLALICSAQNSVSNEIIGWMGNYATNLNIVATYTLLYNAAIMVQEGVGAAICLDGIADISSSSMLCFRPFEPSLDVSMAIAWKKGGALSTASRVFMDLLYAEITRYKAEK